MFGFREEKGEYQEMEDDLCKHVKGSFTLGDAAGLVPDIYKNLLKLDVFTMILFSLLLALGIIRLWAIVKKLGDQKKDKEDNGVSKLDVLVSGQADALALTGISG